MNFKTLSKAAKLDVFAAVIIMACMITVAIALEISAPVIAGVGAVGAAVAGIIRVSYRG